MNLNIIDTHSHLDDVQDLKAALKNAKLSGVEAVIAAGVNRASDEKTLGIAKEFKNQTGYPLIYPAIGFHPGDISIYESDDVFKFIEEHVKEIVAIGELGLDYWYKEARSPGEVRELQEHILTKQLDIAKRHDKPIIVHSRGAWKECLEKARSFGIKKCVFHWYSGPEDILRGILAEGYFVSATPSCEYSPEHRRSIEIAPLERLFLETDSPVMYKPPSGRYKSEPKDVVRVLKEVAKIKKIDETEVARVTTENAKRFFKLP